MDLALNNLQWLICHKTKPTKPNQTKLNIYFGSNISSTDSGVSIFQTKVSIAINQLSIILKSDLSN